MTATAEELETIRTRWSSTDPEHQLLVDNPATGLPFAVVLGSGPEQVDQAVRAAHEGHLSWKRRTPRERGRVLLQAAQLIREHTEELAELECREEGKPRSQARGLDLQSCITIFEYFGGLTESLPSQVRDQGYALDLTILEPYGVVAGIVPFNWPPLHIAGKAAPALAVGNGVVIKPPESAPLTILRIAELVSSVLPDDVLHVVPGGPEVGAALVSHPGVGKIAFTGSTATGRSVAHAAAENLTPALMELGGKNPIIVFDDADLDAALAGAIEGGFFNNGAACTASSRLLVQRGVYDGFVARLGTAVARLRVGDGADDGVHVGPMVSKVQQERILGYLDVGVAEGARVAAQAPLPTDPALDGGYFVPPTVLADVTPEMRVAREEIFGPVVCVIPFGDEEEAVRIANGTDYGLIAGVYSADSERTLRVSRQLDAGMVFVNNYNRAFIGTPFGGTHASGYGRIHAPETLREFGWSKSVRVPSGTSPVPRWNAVDEVLATG